MPRSPFNILFLSSFGNLYGGGQWSLFYLVTNLDKTMFRPIVLLPSAGNFAGELSRHGIEAIIVSLPKIVQLNIFSSLIALCKLYRCVSLRKIDLIHTDGPRNTFYAGLVAMISRIPLVWHVRVSDKDPYDGVLCRLSSKIILVADALRSRFTRIGRRDKFVTVYNGIDLSKYQSVVSEQSVRMKYGIDKDCLMISVTARIEKPKGQKYLIEACRSLKETGGNFCILFVGDDTDEKYRMECEERAGELGIRDRLIFTGYQSDVRHILAETDIFVLPSLSEAFPRSVIEAMASGLPVIVTDVGGCREAVEDGVSGYVVPAGSATSLSDRLIQLSADRKLRNTMGNAARKRVEAMFSIHRHVEGVKRVYEELLHNRI
ncbi:MAG: glycosyltransferase [Deltaproteobacteria bacterium]|nr:glycosyltransferase [Deltaproteobacteria bacterium]